MLLMLSCGSRGAGIATAYYFLKLLLEGFVNQSRHKWVDRGAKQYQHMNNRGFSFTDRVILVSTYLISRCFFMIAQTRQFPTISMTTSKECTVAMAMPDDSSMTEARMSLIAQSEGLLQL